MFHDEEDETAGEPVRGLPSDLPDGEKILWQGAPSAFAFAIHAFHIRFVAAYFLVLGGARATPAAAGGDVQAAIGVFAGSLGAGALVIAILSAIASAMARAAVFTITSKRVVMRFGAAIRHYVNIPFVQISSVMLKKRRGSGDIAFVLSDDAQIGFLRLWPFTRPLRFGRPQPMLRCVADAGAAVEALAAAMKTNAPDRVLLAEQGAPNTGVSAPPPPQHAPAHA